MEAVYKTWGSFHLIGRSSSLHTGYALGLFRVGSEVNFACFLVSNPFDLLLVPGVSGRSFGVKS
jgi:hypothetical protein